MVSGEVPSSFDAYKRKKFFKDARHYYWDEPYSYGGHFATFKTATKVLQSGFMVAYLFKDAATTLPSVIHAKGKGSPRGMRCH
ncbi:unnamed protein product [Microthlaspi erraticum]|uniref:Uncharacterized protein n=1 Tax=Microthlaspi erraticum TaxID=1685480 RepID=A0A6D2JJF7_9BRAS|nr:unnamed protein product [Microthlaspi erraticum]